MLLLEMNLRVRLALMGFLVNSNLFFFVYNEAETYLLVMVAVLT